MRRPRAARSFAQRALSAAGIFVAACGAPPTGAVLPTQPLPALGGVALRPGESCGEVTSALAGAHEAAEIHASYGAPPPLDASPILDVAVGDEAACALTKAGDVVCWNGAPSFMGVRSEEHAPMPEPRVRPGVADAVEIGVGYRHACARLRSGSVTCWGEGYRGELGTTSIGRSRDLPRGEEVNAQPVAKLADVVKLAVGQAHACAVVADGTVWCWGSSYSGQCGVVEEAVYTPVQVEGIANAVDLAAGDRMTCARTKAGKVLCWGSHDDVEQDPKPRGIDASGTSALVVRDRTACAVAENGVDLRCWGDTYGLFDGDARPPVVTLKLPKKARRVSLGGEGLCAAHDDGTVSCRGDVATALTGKEKAGWVDVPGVRDAASVAFGARAVCILDKAGGVSCFGDRHLLGRFTPDEAGVVDVARVEGAIDLVVGDSIACVLRAQGGAQCWGNDRPSRTAPGLFTALEGASDTMSVGLHTCGRSGDALRCTPPGSYDEEPNAVGAPVELPAPVNSVSGSVGHTCATTADGVVWCWGDNSTGQLGFDGGENPEKVTEPARVGGVGGAVSVAAGMCSTCAILVDGSVSCWGCNEEGVLGSGRFAERGAPSPVVGVAGAKKVSVGSGLACALVTGGGVRCWGNDALAAVPWPALEGVLDLDVGGDEACVVLADGAVVCGMPGCAADVPGVADAIKVGVGHSRACALQRDGRVKCWGRRSEHGLGDGELDFALAPVRVLPRPAP